MRRRFPLVSPTPSSAAVARCCQSSRCGARVDGLPFQGRRWSSAGYHRCPCRSRAGTLLLGEAVLQPNVCGPLLTFLTLPLQLRSASWVRLICAMSSRRPARPARRTCVDRPLRDPVEAEGDSSADPGPPRARRSARTTTSRASTHPPRHPSPPTSTRSRTRSRRRPRGSSARPRQSRPGASAAAPSARSTPSLESMSGSRSRFRAASRPT